MKERCKSCLFWKKIKEENKENERIGYCAKLTTGVMIGTGINTILIKSGTKEKQQDYKPLVTPSSFGCAFYGEKK